MGSLYSPQDAITYASTMIKSMPITVSANVGNWPYQTVDYVASLIWNAAPWKWTVGELPSVSVTASSGTDYAVSPPADFQYLVKANLTDGSLQNELRIVSALPSSQVQIGVPSQIAYRDDESLLRLAPKPPASFSQSLVMLYKKQPPKITSSNYATAGAQVFPDSWFPVLQAGVLWMSYQYADDQRAGGATVNEEGKCQYTGQLGVFQSLIAEMRRCERVIIDYPQVPVLHG